MEMGMEKKEIKSRLPESCSELLGNYTEEKRFKGELLEIEKIDGKDVYNITAPFKVNEKEYIIGRVESPDKDNDTQITFFEDRDGSWHIAEGFPSFQLQDPFVTSVGSEIIVGGVELYPSPTEEDLDAVSYRTAFYRGESISNLERFAQGPDTMKDIRLKELPDGKIAVFTRPGDIFTRKKDGIGGKIGYTEIDSLDELTEENIKNAEIIEDFFVDDEWGGVNEVHLLENGLLGVLGHIGRMDADGIKHYYAVTFKFDRVIREVYDLQIVAVRSDFPTGGGGKILSCPVPSRSDILWDIIFSGGMKDNGDGTVDLYVGLSDKEAGVKRGMPNPFM